VTLCAFFVNMCLTQGDGQPFSLDDSVSVIAV